MLNSEAFFEEYGLYPQFALNEKHLVGDAVFLLKFGQKLLYHDSGTWWRKFDVQGFVGF